MYERHSAGGRNHTAQIARLMALARQLSIDGRPAWAHPWIRQRLVQLAIASEALKYTRRSEEHTSELQSPCNIVCRLLLEKKKKKNLKRQITYIKYNDQSIDVKDGSSTKKRSSKYLVPYKGTDITDSKLTLRQLFSGAQRR